MWHARSWIFRPRPRLIERVFANPLLPSLINKFPAQSVCPLTGEGEGESATHARRAWDSGFAALYDNGASNTTPASEGAKMKPPFHPPPHNSRAPHATRSVLGMTAAVISQEPEKDKFRERPQKSCRAEAAARPGRPILRPFGAFTNLWLLLREGIFPPLSLPLRLVTRL